MGTKVETVCKVLFYVHSVALILDGLNWIRDPTYMIPLFFPIPEDDPIYSYIPGQDPDFNLSITLLAFMCRMIGDMLFSYGLVMTLFFDPLSVQSSFLALPHLVMVLMVPTVFGATFNFLPWTVHLILLLKEILRSTVVFNLVASKAKATKSD
jgi:hypothetical protein